MKHSLLHDADWLRTKYVEDKLSLAQIADLAGVPNQNRTTVRRALLRHGIPMRTLSEAMTGGTHVGVPHTEETKRKLSEQRKGMPSKAVWTPEARERMSEQRRGSLNPMYGRSVVWTAEMRQALSEKMREQATKGRLPSYKVMHEWLRWLLDEACVICGTKEGVHSALRRGTSIEHLHLGPQGTPYSVYVEDYVRLCAPHHRQYDVGLIEIEDKPVT
jgi:hypothetical protein